MRQIHRDLTLVGLSHVISAGCLIGIQIFLARQLGSEDFGTFILCQTVANVLEATIVARSGEVALYTLSRVWTKNSTYQESVSGFSAYLRIREFLWNISAYVGLLVASSGLTFFKIINIELLLVALIGLTIPFQTTYGVSKALLVVSGDIKLQSQFQIFYSLCLTFVIILLVLMFGVYGAGLAYVTMALVKTLLAYNITQRFIDANKVKDSIVRPPHNNLSVHAIVRNISKNITTQGDILVLGAVAEPSSVAVYKIAKSLANLPVRISDPLWSVLRPRFLNAIKTLDIKKLKYMIVLPSVMFMIFGYIIVLPILYLYIKPLLGASYGVNYVTASNPFLILFLGTWLYGAVTGWLNFFLIISSNKIFGSAMGVVLAASGLIGAYASKGDIDLLAIWISASLMVASLSAWWLAFKTRYLAK